LGLNWRDSSCGGKSAQHQHDVHQRHAVHQPAVEFCRNAEYRTEADQVVEPVAPELDAAEHAPDQAREHQADDGQH
jgi:hypothetical protein